MTALTFLHYLPALELKNVYRGLTWAVSAWLYDPRIQPILQDCAVWNNALMNKIIHDKVLFMISFLSRLAMYIL